MFDIWLSCVKGNWLFCPHCILRSHLRGQVHCLSRQEMSEHSPGGDCCLPSNPGVAGGTAWPGCVSGVCLMSSRPAGLWGWPAAGGWMAPWHQSSLLCSPGKARDPLRSSVVMGCYLFSQVKLHVQRYSQGFRFTSVNRVMLIILICSSCCDGQQY